MTGDGAQQAGIDPRSLGDIAGVESYALFENQPGDLLICFKLPDDAAPAHCTALFLAEDETGAPVLLLRRRAGSGEGDGNAHVLLGVIPDDMAARLLSRGEADVFCSAGEDQALDRALPVTTQCGEETAPAGGSSDDAGEIGDHLSQFMALGAHSILASGAELG